MEDSLTHYGVKGMKWGVRRYQDKNGKLTATGKSRYREAKKDEEPTVLLKGSRINSVSGTIGNSDTYKSRGRWLYGYDPSDSWDRAVYKGPFSKYLVMGRGARFIAEHKYETVKDLRIPTKKERIDTFRETYEKKSLVYGMELRKIQSMANQYNIDGRSDRKVKFGRRISEADMDDAYAVFNMAMEHVNRYKITRDYAKTMSSRYDGMIDDNNKGVYNRANNPFIVFDPEHVLRKAGDVRFSTVSDIAENYKTVARELEKRGMKVRL